MDKPSVESLTKGTVIKGGVFPEKVEVILTEGESEVLTIYAKGLETGNIYEKVLSAEQLSELELGEEGADLIFSTPGEEFFLGIEANRIRLAFEFDPMFAVNASRVEPVPHQFEAVYKYILPQRPIRYLLADDPGAGKTIMSGLLLKEMKMRGLVDNCIIVVPGHLKYQWLREMRERFGERFNIIDRGTFDASYGTNVWKDRRWCITSLDFARQDEIKETLRTIKWDLAILDEAHKMAAYQYGDKTNKTKRYQIGEVLAENSDNMLLLTATPHKGDPDNFRLLLSLLDQNVFSSTASMERVLSENREQFVLRRMKEDLRDFNGKKIFPPRKVSTIGYELSKPESDLYESITKYVKKYYKRVQKMVDDRRKRNITLALIVLQRRAASSVRALRTSLENRKKKLQDMLDSHHLVQEMEMIYGDLEDMPEDERWKLESALESLTTAQSFEELQDEISELEHLIADARKVEKAEIEAKLLSLKDLVEKRLEKGNPEQKLLIFTEAKSTLEYLAEKLNSWGYSVTTIHGNMNLEARIKAEEEFRHSSQVMIATEAAGEGVNLQFCWMMINYDIPWNPNRLEQRMGRIHRYGQKHPVVFIFNMVALNTREGKVLNKLFEKIELMKEHLGEEKVYDVIGEILENSNAEQLLELVALGEKEVSEAEEQIDGLSVEKTKDNIKKLMGEALAVKVDAPWSDKIFRVSEQNKLVPEYLESFFMRAFDAIAGKGRIKRRSGGFSSIKWVPAEIKDVSYDFRMKYGYVDDRYPKLTFNKELMQEEETADFVAPGHPLMEAVTEKVLERYGPGLASGSVFEDPDGRLHGLIWFLEGSVTDGTGEAIGKRMLSVYTPSSGEAERINASVLWDLKPANTKIDDGLRAQAADKEKVISAAISGDLEKYRKTLRDERHRELEIKKKHALAAVAERIDNIDLRMTEYLEKGGTETDAAFRNWETEIDRLNNAKQKMERRFKKESVLSLTRPRILGVAAVVPASHNGAMSSDSEIEAIGMKLTMEYEKKQGREPTDVSLENKGYDVFSESESDVRYIEVKARATEGQVILTPNEWMTAKQLREKYWLYVVPNAKTEPVVYAIQNPANRLKAAQEIKTVRYVINPEEWKKAVS